MHTLLQNKNLAFQITSTPLGEKLTLKSRYGINGKDAIAYGDKPLISCNIYNEDETYDVAYLLIDFAQSNIDYHPETDGIMPSFFTSPNGQYFVDLLVYHPRKELRVQIPLFDRNNITLPKPAKPFLGHFIGCTKQYSIFSHVDLWSDSKPDQIKSIEYHQTQIKKEHINKISKPRDNRIYIDQESNEIHLLGQDKNQWLHRQINELSKIIHSRSIDMDEYYPAQVLKLSLVNDSYVLDYDYAESAFYIITISSEGNIDAKLLIDIGEEIFSTSEPQHITNDTSITSFTTESGNGWLTIRNGILLEAYYQKTPGTITDLLTNESHQFSSEPLATLAINQIKTINDNSYFVVLYPITEEKNKDLLVLLRHLNHNH